MLLIRIFYVVLLIVLFVAFPHAKAMLVTTGEMGLLHYGFFGAIFALPAAGLISLLLYERRVIESDKLTWPFATFPVALVFLLLLEKQERRRFGEIDAITSRAIAQAKAGSDGNQVCEELKKFSEREVETCKEIVKAGPGQ